MAQQMGTAAEASHSWTQFLLHVFLQLTEIPLGCRRYARELTWSMTCQLGATRGQVNDRFRRRCRCSGGSEVSHMARSTPERRPNNHRPAEKCSRGTTPQVVGIIMVWSGTCSKVNNYKQEEKKATYLHRNTVQETYTTRHSNYRPCNPREKAADMNMLRWVIKCLIQRWHQIKQRGR